MPPNVSIDNCQSVLQEMDGVVYLNQSLNTFKTMQSIMKRLMFGVAGAVLTAPSLVSAQWTAGRANAQGTGLPGGSVYDIIENTLGWLLAILGFIAILGFVISGIMYLTSAGDEGQAEKAKNAMKYSIIGVIVALMGWVIIQAVDRLLGLTNPYF